MSTNNPSQKSVVLESSVKSSLGKQACLGLVRQEIQEPLTQDAKLLRVLGVNSYNVAAHSNPLLTETNLLGMFMVV